MGVMISINTHLSATCIAEGERRGDVGYSMTNATLLFDGGSTHPFISIIHRKDSHNGLRLEPMGVPPTASALVRDGSAKVAAPGRLASGAW